jgi:hypothetical protein
MRVTLWITTVIHLDTQLGKSDTSSIVKLAERDRLIHQIREICDQG